MNTSPEAARKNTHVSKSGGRVAGADAVAGEITLEPLTPRKGDRVRVSLRGIDAVSASVTWIVNGEEQPAGRSFSFDTSRLSRGDELSVMVRSGDSVYEAGPVRIGNTPPRISRLWLQPLNPDRTAVLVADADVVDPDGDETEIIYRWYVNDELVLEETGASRLKDAFKRGDVVTVTAVPFDGEAEGRGRSRSVTITNAPPVAHMERLKTEISGKLYRIKIPVSDPDGDRLEFTLESGPDGMILDPATGELDWQIPEREGEYTAVVSVKDPAGMEIAVTIPITVKAETR